MKPFFDNPAAVARLQSVADQWLGTPFMPNAAIKGAGVSCQKLVGAIYVESGFLPAGFQIPEGPMEWSNAHHDSLIAAFMETLPEFETMPSTALVQPGDMVGFKLGGCVHHCGVVIGGGGKFIHCLRGHGAMFSSLRDASYLKRIEKIWRPICPAEVAL